MWSFLTPKPTKPEPLPEIEHDAIVRGMAERRRCRHCSHMFQPGEESAMLRAGWCFTCETNWMEARLQRLVDRLGRKATLAAFRRLTR